MKINRIKAAHIFSVSCIIIAFVLFVLLAFTPLFNPGRIYYNDKFLFSESDNYHSYGASVTTLQANYKNEFSFQSFSGAQTVYILEAAKDTQLTISWNVNVKQGKFKVVLIDLKNSKTVETICDGTADGRMDNYHLADGEYRIKFVGDNANLTGQFYIAQE